MPKLKVWLTRTFRPANPCFSQTCIHVHKPISYGMNTHTDVVNGVGGIGWMGEWPHEQVPLPEGKHLGLKPGECKRAILIVED